VIEFKFEGGDRLIKALRNKGSAISRNLYPTMQTITQRLRADIVSKKLSGNPLKRRTGRLAQSITSLVTRTEKDIIGRVGTNVKYARLHEYGGEIKPKRAKWLTIPLAAAKTPAGVARGRARDFENTFFKFSSAGNLILFQRRGDNIIPLFLLKKSVTIPKRSYMGSTLKENLNSITKMIKKAVKDGLKKK